MYTAENKTFYLIHIPIKVIADTAGKLPSPPTPYNYKVKGRSAESQKTEPSMEPGTSGNLYIDYTLISDIFA